MDKFKISANLKIRVVCDIIFALTLAGGAIALLNTSLYRMTDQGPFIFFGMFCWFAYNCWKLIKISTFSVEISDEGIKVKDVYRNWQDIASAEIKKVYGRMKPAIILKTTDGTLLSIPSAIISKDYIVALVEKHVKDISK